MIPYVEPPKKGEQFGLGVAGDRTIVAFIDGGENILL